MLNELDELIKYYEKDTPLMDNYWYDEEFEKALLILEKFQEEDWNKLIEVLPEKSSQWKKRLAYCLFDYTNKNNLRVLQEMIDTDDIELFVGIVNRLLGWDLEAIDKKDEIYDKINFFMPEANNVFKTIFNEFCERLAKNGVSFN